MAPVLSGYIPDYVQHLKETGARLGLHNELHPSVVSRNEAEDAAKGLTEPHDLSGWAPAECNAFFRALSVHSKWRPDLIAACIPTKSEWEVWTYLEALEDGATRLTMQPDNKDEDENMRVEAYSDSDSYSGSCQDNLKDDDGGLCEPALEVSQAWIDVEECMAARIVGAESLAAVKSGAAPPDHYSPSPESTSTSAREREALMARLELPQLLVLDNILREGEEAGREGSISKEALVTAPTLPERGDKKASQAYDEPMQPSRPSDRMTALQETSGASHAVIDPVPLASSGDLVGGWSSRNSSAGCAPAHTQIQGSSSLPGPSTQPMSLEVSLQHGPSDPSTFSFTPTNVLPAANAEQPDLSSSPRSRRRIQKRFYMRRKRALLRGKFGTSDGIVDAAIEKLKPGKRVKPRASETSVVTTSVPCSEESSDVGMETSKNAPRKKKRRGLTLPYKLRAQYAELGVDAAYLREQGMDLMNLSALGKLMGLYSSLEHDEDDEDGPATIQFIDAQLIRHLQAAMVMFVTDVVHRAIVLREREVRLKQRSRAWRQSDQITVSAVKHAVEAIGARYPSHKEYFKALEALDGISTESSPPPLNGSGGSDVGPDVDADSPDLSLHRNLYTPLVCPPNLSVWRMGPLACLSRAYEQEATRTRRGTNTEMEEELMSDETDEEELEAELEEEKERDALDMELAATQEEGLWLITELDNRG